MHRYSVLLVSLFVLCISAQFEDFYKWADEKGIEYNKIAIKSSEQYGNGVYANEDIKEGEKILFVPNTAMITSKNAINHPDFGPAIKPFVSTITAVHLLGLYLLFEKQKQKNSTIAPYLDILPSESSSTLYWTEEELELLQASTVRLFTHNKLISMHNRYQEEVESLLFQERPDFFNSTWLDFSRFKWSLTTLWSRTFSVYIDGEGMAGLVPFADLFNTDAPDIINVAHKMTNNGLELYTKKAVSKDEQLFVVYGRNPIPNGQFLMDYGLFVENHPNDNTLIPAPEWNEKDFFLQDKKRLLDEVSLFREHFALDGKIPIEIISYLRVLHLIEDEVDFYGKILQNQMVTMRNERAAVRQFISHLNRLLDSYTTSIEADEKLLKKKKIPIRTKMAVSLRLSEKKMIQSSIEAAERYRDRLFPEEASINTENKKKKKTK